MQRKITNCNNGKSYQVNLIWIVGHDKELKQCLSDIKEVKNKKKYGK